MPAEKPPADPLTIAPTDFEHFRPEMQRDPIHNAARLKIRRKLDAFGKRLAAHLARKEAAFASRASLHHPYRFNAYKVDSMFVYLSRAPKERKPIQSLLGVDLGKDLDANYVHTLLALEIHEKGIELALRVHQNAWWDGENVKRQVATKDGRERVAAALAQAPDFGLRIHDNRAVLPCEGITAAGLADKFKYYTPGESWLHVEFSIPRDGEFLAEPELEERLFEEFEALMPAYLAIRWHPENNFLFSE